MANKKVTVLFYHDGEPLLVDVFDCDGMTQTIIDSALAWFDDGYATLSVDSKDPDKLIILDSEGKRPGCCFYVQVQELKDG